MTLFGRKVGRKFLSIILGALLMGLNDSLELGLETETLDRIMYLILGFVVVEGTADAASAFGEKKAAAENGKSETPDPDPEQQ